jgi:hypothetical protein
LPVTNKCADESTLNLLISHIPVVHAENLYEKFASSSDEFSTSKVYVLVSILVNTNFKSIYISHSPV